MTQYNQPQERIVTHVPESKSNTQLLETQVRLLTQQLDSQRKRIARMEQTIQQLETHISNISR